MTAQRFAIFESAVGPCGIAWGQHAIIGVALPEADAARTRTRLLRRLPDAREALPPPHVRKVIDAIVALLHGEPIDLSWVALDMDGVPAFDRRVYEIARTIPAGATRTYGQIAEQLQHDPEKWEPVFGKRSCSNKEVERDDDSKKNHPALTRESYPSPEWGLAREVGQALGRNPFPIVVPCHRVLAANSKAGGFSARGGVATKLRLLSIERARTSDAPGLFEGELAFALKPGARRS
jgi:methylated-DNA-[protein]-cysteine S-methyltransferase